MDIKHSIEELNVMGSLMKKEEYLRQCIALQEGLKPAAACWDGSCHVRVTNPEATRTHLLGHDISAEHDIQLRCTLAIKQSDISVSYCI